MSGHSRGIIIAIDGPASSGKSTTAKAVAAELGYRHLDSGAFYRAVTLAALEHAIPAEHWPELTAEQLSTFEIEALPVQRGYRLTVGGGNVEDRIRSPEVNSYVSIMAAVPAVREWLFDTLRRTGSDGGLVADGRDMGTVVFPDAELKIFLVCDPQERAARRLRQQGDPSPTPGAIGQEARRLAERDRHDQERAAAPLVPAADAVILDTSHLAFDTQVRSITDLARLRLRHAG